MSASYASRLSAYPHKGVCGLPETKDTQRSLAYKLKTLTEYCENAIVVVLTGAGISTSAGIPDFRGPAGVWTMESKDAIQKNKSRSKRKSMVCGEEKDHPPCTGSGWQEQRVVPSPESDNIGKEKECPARTKIPSDNSTGTDIDIDADTVTDTDTESNTDLIVKVESRLDTEKGAQTKPLTVPAVSTKRRRISDEILKDSTPTSSSVSKNKDKNLQMDFSKAHPTLTHKAITKLTTAGMVHFCVTQNVDGLHQRSGLSRSHHAVLHGCAFTEKCALCATEYFRDSDVGGMSFQPTGRICEVEGCGGVLHDTLLDWEDALPEEDFHRAEQACALADVVLCLGTSLRIEPAGSLPSLGKKYVIVNLQPTPKDSDAALLIRAPVDTVMTHLVQSLLHVPPGWEKGKSGEVAPPIERQWRMPPSSACDQGE